MRAYNDFTPQDPELERIWARLPEESRRSRFAEAVRREAAVRTVESRPKGQSETKAIESLVPSLDRTNVRRWQERYLEQGFEGLISRRCPPEREPMPGNVRQEICACRRLDPEMQVEKIVGHVAKHHDYSASETVVKRVLRKAGLSRRSGPPSGESKPVAERRLELGGMKLVEAACVETGYVEVLTKSVVEHVKDLPRPDDAGPPDTSGRDDKGRFLSEYNERFEKGPDDPVGPGFASVEMKREGLDPDRLQISHVRPEIIARKLEALLVSPLLGGGRWDGIRVPRGELLEEVCGVAYMPATLDRFTRELKYAGVGNTLWESHARLSLDVTSEWGDPLRAAVLYVDGTTKPVWTRLFSESAKVSSIGRTMPAIEQVAFHSGYGVPLWMLTCSGRAPLVKEVPRALVRMEQEWGESSVGRIVVIDAEGNSIPFLKGLEQGEPTRAWVTRLRPDWVKNKRIFNRNPYRAYRNGDRVRSGVADFNDPDGGTFRMRVVEVERRTTGDITYLGASEILREQDWKPQQLADLYFDRWPNQEANFRAVNQAVGLKEVHGYGKQLVDNITVINELDELAGKADRADERLRNLAPKVSDLQARFAGQEKELDRLVRRKERLAAELHDRVEQRVRPSKRLARLSVEARDLAQAVEAARVGLAKTRSKLDKTRTALDTAVTKLNKYRDREDLLHSRRTIFKHDVELDSLFSLLKVGMVLLVTYVLKEYFDDARMSVGTFLDRVATLPATLHQTPQLEIVTYEYNRRDPEVMGLLKSCAEAINAKGLRLRSGKKLYIKIEPPPKPRHPPPPGSRAGTGDRFKK